VASDKLIEIFLSHLSVERGMSKNTLQSYRRDLESFKNSLATKNLDIASASKVDIEQFIGSLRDEGLKASSIARNVVAIRSLYKFLAKENGIADIAREIKPPRIPKRLPKALTLSEITGLIEALGNDGIALRDRAMVELLYASGARVSEVTSINLTDLSRDDELFTLLVRGKGGKERLVPVGRFAREALDNYLVRIRPTLAKEKRSPALFLNQRGDRLSRQSAWKIIMAAAKRANIESKVTPHALRHSFATHLLDGGADIRVVQELLGHASVTTTQIYTLITIDKLRESYALAHPRSR
jgi:integrase/recombinase XerD